jgi:hypothetical protein
MPPDDITQTPFKKALADVMDLIEADADLWVEDGKVTCSAKELAALITHTLVQPASRESLKRLLDLLDNVF